MSFKWKAENYHKEIEFLYDSLINSKPPFISSSLKTFIKAFTHKHSEEGESIKWLCKNIKNEKQISKVSLVSLLDSLFRGGYIVSDLNYFNKTVKNIFCSPNGEKLKNIKVSKAEKSKNPSRIQEIRAIIDGLSNIA